MLDMYKIGQLSLNPRFEEHVISRTDLHYKDSSSDKVYIVVMSQDKRNKDYCVEAFYGRRGAYLTKSPILMTTDFTEAEKTYNTTISKKKRKQYKDAGVEILNNPIPRSNRETYEPRILWPMGAQPLKEGKKKEEILHSPEWVTEEKEDGVRITVHVTPTGLRMFSRSPGVDDPDKPLEKTHAFPFLMNVVFPEKYVGTIFDTEVMADGMDSATISGHINATDGRDTSFLYFKVFDLLQEGPVDITNLEWKYRRMKLTQIFKELQMISLKADMLPSQKKNALSEFLFDPNDSFDNGYFRMSRYTINNKVEFHDSIIAAGGEGTMWKNINGIYKEGVKPANNWYKWKKQETADVVILGFTEGKGKYLNQIGAVRYGEFLTDEEIAHYKNKKQPQGHAFINGKDRYLVEIGQCSGMTDEQRLKFTNKQGDYIGRIIEVEYMERTKTGSCRHPRFLRMRSDKTPEMCVHEDQK